MRSRTFKAQCRFWGTVVGVCISWLMCGCQTSSLTRNESRKEICIGYAVEAPYAFLQPDGTITGYAPEIAKQVAKELGFEHVRWRQLDFDDLMPELQAGDIDVIAAGMFITKERAKKICFSEPIARVQEALLVAKGNPLGLHSYAQIVGTSQLKVAVIAGSVEEEIFRRSGLTATHMLKVPDALTGRTAVENRQADCLALSSPAIRWMAMHEQLGKTEMAEMRPDAKRVIPADFGSVAFAFRLEDKALRESWNRTQRQFVVSPDYQRLVTRFGFTPAESPIALNRTEDLRP